jgi:hypothetical protein
MRRISRRKGRRSLARNAAKSRFQMLIVSFLTVVARIGLRAAFHAWTHAG